MAESMEVPGSGMTGGVAEVLSALADKQSQLDLRIKSLTLDFKGTPLTIELNGDVTVSVHLRNLSPEEKRARERETVERLSP